MEKKQRATRRTAASVDVEQEFEKRKEWITNAVKDKTPDRAIWRAIYAPGVNARVRECLAAFYEGVLTGAAL